MMMERLGRRTSERRGIPFALAVLGALIVAAVAAPAPALAAGSETVWRAYNRYSGEHLFTTDRAEYDRLGRAGWRLEGEGWQAPTSGDPVYRLNNLYSGDHHFTTDRAEYDRLGREGWRQEGVAFHSAPSTGRPVYRLYNPYVSKGTHHYTTGLIEYANLGRLENGWRQERTCWYALGTPDPLPSGWTTVSGTLLKTTVAQRARDLINAGKMPNESRFDPYLRNYSQFTCIEFGREIQIGSKNKYGNYQMMTADFIDPILDFTDYGNGQQLTLAVNQYENSRGVSWSGAFYGIGAYQCAIL